MKYSDNVVTHHKINDFEYLTFKALEKYEDKLVHFITLRHGGVSKGYYDSLNLRAVSKDGIKNVNKNFEIVCDNMDIDKNKVYKAKQDHTDNILILNSDNKEKYNFYNLSKDAYDAYIINEKEIANFITTADCNPIIVYDKKKNIVLNVHAGWKGVASQIYLKGIKMLVNDFYSNVKDLIVCIGPSIRKCCFSSEDENFKRIFTDKWKDEEKYIYYEDDNKRFHIDLIYLIKNDLIALGIDESNINIADICTCDNYNDFYSYRKSTINKDSDYATFSTWVKLK